MNLRLNQTVTYNGRPHQLITLPIPSRRKTAYVTIREPDDQSRPPGQP